MSNLVFSAGLIGDWFKGIWIGLWLMVDNVIYLFINWVYRIFMLVAEVDIFSSGDQIEAITRRIYIIIGIAMLFIFAYNLILLIINPEGKQLGDMGKIVKNAIFSIILVTFLPLIFSYLTTIQKHVLESNVIARVILGTSANEASKTKKQAGVETALIIFSAFYHPTGESYYSCENSSHDLCDEYRKAYDEAFDNESISKFVFDPDLKDGAIDDEMEYNYILSTIAGVFALWCFISFALDIGVRVGKLAFYELISPIPVMMRILPGDKMFKKWFDGITKTYLSLFTRLLIIYFCMYLITLVPDVIDGLTTLQAENPILKALAMVVLILGILKFAQEAPKLVSDLFGSLGSGELSFGIGKKIKDNKLAMAGMGAIGGGAVGLASNVRKMFGSKEEGYKFKGFSNPARGVISGAVKGGKGGYKAQNFSQLGDAITEGRDQTAEVNKKYKTRREDGRAAIIASRDDAHKESYGDSVRNKMVDEDGNTTRTGKIIGAVTDWATENIAGRGVHVKDAVVNAKDTTLSYLNAGAETSSEAKTNVEKAKSAIESMQKAFSSGIGEIEATTKAWKDEYDRNSKINKEILEFMQNNAKKDGTSYDKTKREDVRAAIDEWEKQRKNEKYGANFDKEDNARLLSVYKDQVVNALEKALPYMSAELVESINKACGGTSIQQSIEILQTTTGTELVEKIDGVNRSLDQESKYLNAAVPPKNEKKSS